MYGSWSLCQACGSYFFNDKYFSEAVYQDQVTSTTPDLLAAHRRGVPDDPVCHAPGEVGVSSRWWYLPGMYSPSVDRCHCCTGAESGGEALTRRMAGSSTGPVVSRTGELYRIPLVVKSGGEAKECVSWPRYWQGEFVRDQAGPSMLELTEQEWRALVIVVLKTEVKQERYGTAHQFNWKKVGLSRAYYKKELVTVEAAEVVVLVLLFGLFVLRVVLLLLLLVLLFGLLVLLFGLLVLRVLLLLLLLLVLLLLLLLSS